MKNVLFICHGNICRSPMAEFIFKDMVKKRGIAGQFHIESAAVSSEEIGNPVYPPAKRRLAKAGISCEGKTARKVTREDYGNFDYLIAMEKYNLDRLYRITGGDPDVKIHLLLDYTGRGGDIADPWYTGNFDVTYDDITEGLEGFLEHLGFKKD